MRWLFSLLLLALLLFAFFLFWGAEDYLSRYLTDQLGTKTTIRSVGVGTGSLTLKGIEIFNPKRSKITHAFYARMIQMEAPWSTYFKKSIHLDTLRLDSVKMGIEFYNSSGSSNNWAHILKTMPVSSSNRLIEVDRLTIANIQFDVLKGGKSVEVSKIPYLEFRNLGNLTTAELVRLIFHSILSAATHEAPLSKILNNVVSPIQSLEPQKMKKEEKIPEEESLTGQLLESLFSLSK